MSMYNNYPGYAVAGYQLPQQLYNTQPTQPIGLKGRPVSSLDEARVANIDFDGSTFFFPDIANRKIYTKQINLDGTPSFKIYSLDETVVQPPQANYVTKEEFDAVVEELKTLKETLQQKQPKVNF